MTIEYTINEKLDQILELLTRPNQKPAPKKKIPHRGKVQPFVYAKMKDGALWCGPAIQIEVKKAFPDAVESTGRDALKALALKGKIKRVATNVYQRRV